MNLNRISKKVPHEDNRMTMLAIHENKIKEFKIYYATLPEKEKKLESLIKKNKKTFELNKQIISLENEIKNIREQTELSEYLLKASFYLKEYKDEIKKTNEIELETNDGEIEYTIIKSNKGIISNKYIQNCLGNTFENGNIINNNNIKCETCGIYRIINSKEATAVCTECGTTISYQSLDSCNEFSEEIEVLSPFSYKRINHLKEWISTVLARETSSPPQDVIDIILLELKKDRITDKNKVNYIRIRSYLKKNGLNRMYEHIPAIIFKICGTKPPSISRELENNLLKMFDEMQIPYDRHKNPDRKNFLSYAYCLHKLCQMLQEYELAKHFSLLKSRDKLYEQDRLFEKICGDLGWTFVPSI